MSLGWEVTEEDVMIVLERHNVIKTADEISVIYDSIDPDEVEEAVMAYIDFDDQVEAALKEIELQLREHGIINSSKA